MEAQHKIPEEPGHVAVNLSLLEHTARKVIYLFSGARVCRHGF